MEADNERGVKLLFLPPLSLFLFRRGSFYALGATKRIATAILTLELERPCLLIVCEGKFASAHTVCDPVLHL
jgi:hypothetical protein